LGFTLAHPAVTAPIIGPRTMEQLEGLLGAADVKLDDDTLDAIDKVVPPGTTINPADNGHVTPPIAAPWRRRRPYDAR
jgi:aryl-alcohol dehydrogenase-like predicted oxidoreductase